MSARFDFVSDGDWGGLLRLLMQDKEELRLRSTRGQARQGRRNPEEEGDRCKEAKLRKTVLGFLARGQIGRAVRRMTSHGMASIEEPWVLEALKSKYPPRGRAMPATVA